MSHRMGVSASIGANTEKELVIGNYAIEHIERVALLYPGQYYPEYHMDVFKDVKDLFMVCLTTNRKNIVKKYSRAVGVRDYEEALGEAEARNIVWRTKFISHGRGEWEIEVETACRSGTLVEASTRRQEDDLKHGDPLSDKDPEGKEAILEEQRTAIQKEKADLEHLEFTQLSKLRAMMELKKEYATLLNEYQTVERTTLLARRENVKTMDKKYFRNLTLMD